MENNKDLHETFYRMESMVDIMYVYYEDKMAKEEKERA